MKGYKMGDNKVCDVQDVINAGFNLEPLKCRWCDTVGETTFNQKIGDAHCEACGEWQLDEHAVRHELS